MGGNLLGFGIACVKLKTPSTILAFNINCKLFSRLFISEKPNICPELVVRRKKKRQNVYISKIVERIFFLKIMMDSFF